MMLAVAPHGSVLRARLMPTPAHPRALPMLLEALSAWYRLPLHAVLDADASDVQRHPEKWAQFLGDMPSAGIEVHWVGVPQTGQRPRDRFLGQLGDFSSAGRLLRIASTGLR